MPSVPCPVTMTLSLREGAATSPHHGTQAAFSETVAQQPAPPECEMRAASSTPGLLGSLFYLALVYWALYVEILLFCHETCVVRHDPTGGSCYQSMHTHRRMKGLSFPPRSQADFLLFEHKTHGSKSSVPRGRYKLPRGPTAPRALCLQSLSHVQRHLQF